VSRLLQPFVLSLAKSFGLVFFSSLVVFFAVLHHAWVFPAGSIGSSLLITVLALTVRRLFYHRSYLALVVAVVILVLMFAAGVGGAGSFFIVANSSGFLFLVLTTVGLVIAIAWPRFPPRTNRYHRAVERSERTLQP
jgi:hypothetical protein